jgi:hypothetical protein
MRNRTIFTFWEPKEKMPGYLKLCMETWKKYLPSYKIVTLDYSNLDEWLGKNYFDPRLYKNFPLPKQADAARCAILKNYGGIWFDADTVIISGNMEKIFETDAEVLMFGNGAMSPQLAFIAAEKNAPILGKWENKIRENILEYDKYFSKYNSMPLLYKIFYRPATKKFRRRLRHFGYLGNDILSEIMDPKNEKELVALRGKFYDDVFPDAYLQNQIKNSKNNSLLFSKPSDFYRIFYFEWDLSNFVLNPDNIGILLLHNSWTPDKYKKMSRKEFLEQNNTLANIFKKIL